MNYDRLYRSFIERVLAKEPKQFKGRPYHSRRYVKTNGAFYQHHHIVPRDFGGKHSSDNMVSLTPREHIHAHLLLAKIHGNKMWGAAKLLLDVYGDESRIPSKKKIWYASFAAQKHAESISGNGNPFFGKSHTEQTKNKIRRDFNVYNFAHKDGQIVSGCQNELVKLTGLSAVKVSALCRGNRKTALGWRNLDVLNEHRSKSEMIREFWRNNQNTITLYNKDGRVWSGFPVDAPVKIYTLSDGRNKHVEGWFLSKDELLNYKSNRLTRAKSASLARGNISGANNPRADNRCFKWKNENTGDVFVGTRFESWSSGKMTKTGIASVFSGRQTKTNGWVFIGEAC